MSKASLPPELPAQQAEALMRSERFRQLASELRCLVCQNQTLADSNAELADDLRNEVLRQMAAGKDDNQIKAHLVARYGEFVLYRPTASPHNLALWAGPAVLAATGGLILWRLTRRRQAFASAELQHAQDETALNQRLDEMLNESGGQKKQKRP
jgi:cytochrome c-type biogenesis protein CcmH